MNKIKVALSHYCCRTTLQCQCHETVTMTEFLTSHYVAWFKIPKAAEYRGRLLSAAMWICLTRTSTLDTHWHLIFTLHQQSVSTGTCTAEFLQHDQTVKFFDDLIARTHSFTLWILHTEPSDNIIVLLACAQNNASFHNQHKTVIWQNKPIDIDINH